VKQFEKQLNTDVDAFDKALSEAVNQALKEACSGTADLPRATAYSPEGE